MQRKELLIIIQSLMPGVDLNETSSDKIYFSKNNIATNTNEIQVKINYDIGFECCIYANKIIPILQKIKSDDISISVQENQFIIQSKKTTFSLPFVEASPIDFNSEFDIADFSVLDDLFFHDLKLALISVDSTEQNYPFNYINVQNGKILTTDNHRASIINTQYKGNSFLLPYHIIKDLLKYSMTHIQVTDNIIYFYDEKNKLHFICKNTFHGNFPDVENVFKNNDQDKTEITFPDSLIDSIDTISIMSNELNNSLSIKIKDKKIICSASNSYGKAKETIDSDIEGNTSFKVNAAFFKEILYRIKTAQLNANTMMFTTNNFKHIIALIKEKDGI